MRALVLGVPLPHPEFDNYSFLSAPSFFDYEVMVVEGRAVTTAIAQVVAGEPTHHAFDGRRVVNGPSSPEAISLAELVRLRRLETRRFLARGGLLVLFAYPDVPVPGVEGLAHLHRYYWLPEPGGRSWQEVLVPGFGARGAAVCDPSHPFAKYVEAYGPRLAFHAHLEEGLGLEAKVFARSPGGAAVAVELALEGGRLVILPPIGDLNPTYDRIPLAQTVHGCIVAALEAVGQALGGG